MDARAAWILNLDADLELGARGHYTPSKAVLTAMRSQIDRLAASLLRPGDLLVDETSARNAARGFVGRAFCPTPRATALLRRAGAEPDVHPPVDVLRAVNSRAFSSALGATLPGGAFVTSLDEALAKLGEVPPVGHAWRVKRAFGMAGRGQRVVSAACASDRAFVESAMRDGGVQIEPNVALVTEYAIHGWIAKDGKFTVGELVTQECDRHGQWLQTKRATANDDPAIARAMVAEAHRVASALTAAGYFGPFGIDAFTYNDDHGSVGWQPRSEINARYSMGYPIALTH
ncbi:MAG: ATP-grasp domain-containing protein [Polyangiaceae bacterium]|nr:ATP-grasp domain-containing protein [Polyangiaceae bacterium]